jgi:hypothetical protein
MAFVPRGAGILDALGDEVIRRDLWAGAIFGAITGRSICGIAARIGGRRSVERGEPGCRIELRQAIERAVGEAVVFPVRTQGSEVVIEAAILLRHEDNVVQNLDRLIHVESGGGSFAGVHGQRASAGAFTGAGPSGEKISLGGDGGQFHAGAGVERRAAGGWATNACGSARYGAGGVARSLDSQGVGGRRGGGGGLHWCGLGRESRGRKTKRDQNHCTHKSLMTNQQGLRWLEKKTCFGWLGGSERLAEKSGCRRMSRSRGASPTRAEAAVAP